MPLSAIFQLYNHGDQF